jgi:hypothetical protein
MVISPRHAAASGLALLGLWGGYALWGRLRIEEAAAVGTRGSAPSGDVPRIALGRLEEGRAAPREAGRDIFDYGRPPATPRPPTPPPTPAPVATPAPAVAAGPVTPPLPPLNWTYIGSVESQAGLRVAVLLTEQKEILWGRAGETVGNRVKIVKIGLESVDVQQVGSEQVRRLPLKGGS